MFTRPVSDEALSQRMLPQSNADRQDRERAWAEWQASVGEPVLTRFVRAHNNTHETDEDIIQDTLLTAYLGIERGAYRPQNGVPFVAYVVGIARNKVREAWRRERHRADLEDVEAAADRYPADRHAADLRLVDTLQRQPEHAIERREQRNLLRSGLSRLPGVRRQVLEYYLSGASTGEIANRLAMSEALVRQHKCRGLRSLQRDLIGTDAANLAV